MPYLASSKRRTAAPPTRFKPHQNHLMTIVVMGAMIGAVCLTSAILA